jgi:hypothetical protein
MTIAIRKVGDGDRAEWLRMRRALWDDCPDEQQVREMEEGLANDAEEVFVAERPEGGLCGFVEASIRPCAIGCGPARSAMSRAGTSMRTSDGEVSAGLWSKPPRRG